MTRRILFVDDEENILHGLRRSLHKMRGEWEMSFALGGESAIQNLDRMYFDAIISDMRMPGMDGAQLMDQARKRQPDSLRIILSGETDQLNFARTVGPAHQYLSKPCPSETLINLVQRGIGLRRYIGNDAIRAKIGGIETLPMPPSVILDVLKELDSENANAKVVASIIERDVGLTTQVLRLANSAFFSIPVTVTSPQQAVTMLGFDSIKATILAASIFNAFDIGPEEEKKLHRLAHNSFAIGAVAQALAEAEGAGATLVGHALCAGSVSHIGTLMLMYYCPDAFKEAETSCEEGSTTIHEAEQDLIGSGHGAFGGYLLGLWGFNDSIIEAVAYHHEPQRSGHTELAPLTFVHAAQHLCTILSKPNTTDDPSLYSLDMNYLEQVGLISRLDDWREIASSILKEEDISHG
ncbi:MAG: HDOD domain-containing protein [Rhodospirillaceae bacterium]|nr:HDOD domain-containing protein [Rhodospirillaceae bacterium]